MTSRHTTTENHSNHSIDAGQASKEAARIQSGQETEGLSRPVDPMPPDRLSDTNVSRNKSQILHETGVQEVPTMKAPLDDESAAIGSQDHKQDFVMEKKSKGGRVRLSMIAVEDGGIDTFGWAMRELDFDEDDDVDDAEADSDNLDTFGWSSRSLDLDEADAEVDSDNDSGSEVAAAASPRSLRDRGEEDVDAEVDNENGSEAASPSGRPLSSSPLGPGPLRFAQGPCERSVQSQVDDLFAHERRCFDSVKDNWENMWGDRGLASARRKVRPRSSAAAGAAFTDAQYLHFARCANFDEEAALALMLSSTRRYLRLRCAALEAQLKTKTIFIPPGLRSREGYDVFYMRCCRYFPKQMKTSDVIDNLAYIMQVMLEREQSSKEGIVFLANMADWEMTNFSTGYCLQFMKTLQGDYFPIEVRIFLIVDPPVWFDKIWSIMKKMLTKSFQNRVKMIPSSELGDYLDDRYELFLPDDMEGGTQSTDGICDDFIAFRKHVER